MWHALLLLGEFLHGQRHQVVETAFTQLRDSSAVSLGESQGHGAQEFIKGDVNLWGEVPGEHDGNHHLNALGQDLQREET